MGAEGVKAMTWEEWEALSPEDRERAGDFDDWKDEVHPDPDVEMAQVGPSPVREKKEKGPSKLKPGHAHLAHALKKLGVQVGVLNDD